MAVFIKKENLGSRPPPRKSIMRTVESMQTFQALQQHYAQQKEQKKQELKEKWDSNAEVQHWRTQMTPEERTRDAIERMVPTTKEVLKMRNGGNEVSYEEGRKKAEEIAYKSEKQKKED
jgi:hypothetical protein